MGGGFCLAGEQQFRGIGVYGGEIILNITI